MLIKSAIIILMVFNEAYASESINKAVSMAIEIPTTINFLLQPKAPTCSVEEIYSCPPFFHQILSDNFSGGLVGLVNVVVSDGSLSTPDKVCKGGALEIPDSELIKRLKGNSPLFNKAGFCVDQFKDFKLSTDEQKRARQFVLSSLVYKEQQLKAGNDNMLEAKTQLDLLLDQSSCHSHPPGYFFNKKVDEIKNVMNAAAFLRKERRHYRTKGGNPENVKKIDATLENIYTLYPMLQNTSLKEDEIKTKLKIDLLKTRSLVEVKLKKLKRAESCLEGSSSNCSEVEKTLSETAPFWRPAGNLPYESYYQCIQNTKENRDTSNKILNDVALNAALALTPMGIIGGAKLLYQSGKLIKNASTVAKIKSASIVTTSASDAAITGHEIAKIAEACERKLEVFKTYQENPDPLSCNMQEMKAASALDVSACNQQIVLAGVSALFSGFGISGAVKMTAVSKEPVNTLLTIVGRDDHELSDLIENTFSNIKNPATRENSFSDLNVRLGTLAKSKEYSPEEIRAALKVYLKKCAK